MGCLRIVEWVEYELLEGDFSYVWEKMNELEVRALNKAKDGKECVPVVGVIMIETPTGYEHVYNILVEDKEKIQQIIDEAIERMLRW